ncbi:acyltransferase family protein [Thioalkalivibrio sp. ALE12]|uniref:acyltransferase family protein n=1 Tax=Thioalkalivibrio sp. ALE12 TaxID=1158170 RepID=UPI0003819D32|nr:acyltransferase family protein [Thioalkalivibrio sp. ALE12]
MNFRHDINGLRAIAVVAVVLFHFQVPGFDAGYLGVDIFFVISGFLMAAILMRGLDSNPVPGGILWSFYLARARRIVPALVVLVAALLVAGWWTLSPADYEQLANHARYALGFASNHRFWEEAGYFDVASHEKWLLHTWSLSVEWQFYLLLPIGFLLVWWWRRSRAWLTAVVLVAFLVSLGLSVWLTGRSPSAAFYLLPTRAWELLAGVLVYLLGDYVSGSDRLRRGLELAGLGLIVAALVVFDANTPWPGAAALLPVLGTALILLAMRHTPGWATPAPVQWLGQVSYSLYLWHWPVFVALVFLDWRGLPWAVALGMGVSLVLAAMSYRLVEQPSRRWLTHAGHGVAVAALVVPVVLLMAFALWVKSADGVDDRMPPRFDAIMAEAQNTNPHRDECHGRPGWDAFPWCHLGGETPRAVVIGDSHASAIATAVLEAVSDTPDAGIIQATYTSCQTLFGARKPREDLECAEFNRFVEQRLAELPSDVPVVVGNRLSSAAFGSHIPHEPRYGIPTVYFGDRPVQRPDEAFLAEFRQEVIDSACRLGEDRPVYWMRPTPEMMVDVPRWYARQTVLRAGFDFDVRLPREDYEARHALVTEALRTAERQCDNLHLLDPEPALCEGGYCYGTRDGLPLYYDEHHLSERGNRALVPLLREALQPKEPHDTDR